MPDKKIPFIVTEENYEEINPEKGTLMGDDIYRYVFFNGASREDKLKMVGRILKAALGSKWDSETNAITDIEARKPVEYTDVEDPNLLSGLGCLVVVDTEKSFYPIKFLRGVYPSEKKERTLTKTNQGEEEANKPKSSPSLVGPAQIVFADGDVLGDGLPKYTVQPIIEETGEVLGLPLNMIFIDSNKGNEETELGRLVSDLTQKDPNKMYDEVFRKRAEEVLASPELAQTYNHYFEILNKGSEEKRIQREVEEAQLKKSLKNKDKNPNN